jgi:hypothetical protein
MYKKTAVLSPPSYLLLWTLLAAGYQEKLRKKLREILYNEP